MGVAGQTPTTGAGRLGCELKAKGEEKGEDAFDKRFAIAKQLIIGRFVVKVDSNGPVITSLAGGVAHGSSSGQIVAVADDPTWGNACAIARGWEDVEALPLNWVECGRYSRCMRRQRERVIACMLFKNAIESLVQRF